MENSNNDTIKDQNKNIHPQPNDDAGAKIETVTPDTEKEGAPNEMKPSSADIKQVAPADEQDEVGAKVEKDIPDAKGKEKVDPETTEPEQNQGKGDAPDIETISP